MPTDEFEDDEDWYDDPDDGPESDGDDVVACPECGEPVHDLADRCPACGYWLSEADLRRPSSGPFNPLWLKVTVVFVLVTFLASLLAWTAAGP